MFSHTPVMLEQAIENLRIDPAGTYLDTTYGRGGHSKAILQCLKGGNLVVMDKDPQAISSAKELAKSYPHLKVIHSDYSRLGDWLIAHNIKVNGVLFDLGVSSIQLDDPQRGFSFQKDAPLDMRMNNSSGLTATQWLNQVDEKELEETLREYGEEKYARNIARNICKARPINTTLQLVDIVKQTQAGKEYRKHPATRTFQALRIAVNNELEMLHKALESLKNVMLKGARLVVISFHSLEDRIVKKFIAANSGKRYPSSVPTMEWLEKPVFTPVGRYFPSKQELESNKRSRSAVMRVAEFVG